MPTRKTGVADTTEELRLGVLTRQHVEAVVREHGPERAWRELGIARNTLYRWRRKWKREDHAAEAAGRATAEALRVTRGEGENSR